MVEPTHLQCVICVWLKNQERFWAAMYNDGPVVLEVREDRSCDCQLTESVTGPS